MSQENHLLSKIFTQLKLLVNKGNSESAGTSNTQEATLQQVVDNTDQLETLITQNNTILSNIETSNENKNHTISIEEQTTDGTTLTNNIVSLSVTLLGEGGSINGVALPNGTSFSFQNDEGGLITNSITYIVPTSGEQRVIIAYTRIV